MLPARTRSRTFPSRSDSACGTISPTKPISPETETAAAVSSAAVGYSLMVPAALLVLAGSALRTAGRRLGEEGARPHRIRYKPISR